MDAAVEMKGIKKSFGANYVLKEVDFAVEKGSIHALLGENGAGKSTLMNILGNVIGKDAGTIFIEGEEVDPLHNARVIDEKVAFIFQELSLVNDLNIYENLFLGHELKKGILLDRKTMRRKAKEVLDRMGVATNPNTLVSDLNPSYKQITEIARALLKNARIIIMDEPTTSLTDVEIKRIFEVMKTLREQGISLIFISHKLNEVIEICDSYTILRDGAVVAVGKIEDGITEKDLSAHMVGKEVISEGIYRARELGGVVLEIKNMSRGREYRDVNMYLRKGEILGVTGLLGDGRTELFASVYGANGPYEGEVRVDGRVVNMRNTSAAKNNRIGYLPKNRKENAIIPDLSIRENLVLSIMPNISPQGVIKRKKQDDITNSYVEKLDIRVADIKNLITSLSGGNQQKVVLSRALCIDPKVLILDNPTQGVDVGAKMEIYRQIVSLAEQGYSFIVLSNEIPELQRTCDRVYVMFHGEVRHEFSRGEMTEENIMLVATGGIIANNERAG
ncbi:MAG: sugar ABC transporter ATP-binding protein [Defluviitaleaceae bacterium]|nr:sugar ABC transporter ATP-binding protein [Defluviitaleaceae bacterium]